MRTEKALSPQSAGSRCCCIYDRRADLGDRALDALIIARRDVDGALIVGDEVIFEQHLTVVRLAVGDRRADGDDLYWLTLTIAYILTSSLASLSAMKYVGCSAMFSSSGNVAV